MYTTHIDKLTKMKIEVRFGAVDIKHPTGVMQTHSIEDVFGFRADKMTELKSLQEELVILDVWLIDME